MKRKHNNIDRIADYIRRGEKHPDEHKIGLELEHFVIDKNTGRSMDCEGAHGVCGFLPKVSRYFDEEIYIDGYLMGMKRSDCYLTLEPAAQVEVSINPYRSLAAIRDVYRSFHEDVSEVLSQDGLKLATIGYHPVSKIDELKMIPKNRYRYMSEYLPKKGKYALNMMKGTSSVQVVIDYADEHDFKKKFRLANCLCPLFYYLTDNSPVFEGAVFNGRMVRAQIWDHVDPERSGLTTGALDRSFGYEDYAEYIYQHPSVLTLVDQEIRFTNQTPLSEIFENRTMTQDEIVFAMSMFFPDVRVRNYIEIRVGDSMPIDFSMGYTALIKGLFYHQELLDKYSSFFAQADTVEIRDWKARLIEFGNDASLYGKNVKELLLEMFADARSVLQEEAVFLDPLESVVRSELRIWQTEQMKEFQYL